MEYSNKKYWSELVGNEMSLREVGWPNWSEAFNTYRYKHTAKLTKKALNSLMSSPPKRILEIGCGVGFWTSLLTKLYPDALYYGVDISKKTIDNLSKKFDSKNVTFTNIDFGVPFNELPEELKNQTFDLVVCFEVLLHIVDKNAWQHALSNICKLQGEKGLAMLSEPFYMFESMKSYEKTSIDNVRTLNDFNTIINLNNKKVVKIEPRTFLLDNNFDFKYKFTKQLWVKFFILWNRILSIKSEKLGSFLGKCAYFIDSVFVRWSLYGNSCRLLIFR